MSGEDNGAPEEWPIPDTAPSVDRDPGSTPLLEPPRAFDPELPDDAPPSDPPPATEPQPPLSRVIPGCVLAWALPGLGHVVLGRPARGFLFGVLILTLFVGGLWMDGKVYRPVEDEPLSYIAALGAAGAGVPFLVAHGTGWADGDITSAYHDYGNTFTLVAGLLNLLVVLDAFDVAAGRR